MGIYDEYRMAYHNAVDEPKLVDVTLEVSSVCNMSCKYCYHADKHHLPFRQGIMWPKTFKKIINQAKDMEVYSVKLNWRGEPTLNPYFRLMTEYVANLAKGRTFIDRITNSNFFFKNEDVFHALMHQTKVKISFDSFNKEVFERQRSRGVHEAIIKNIDRFYNWPGRNNIVVIQAVRTKLNKDEDFEGEVKKRWPSALVSVRDMVEGRVDRDLADFTNVSRGGDSGISIRKPCVQASARLIFDLDGYATVCCPDTKMMHKLGSIENSSLFDLFYSPKAKKIRKRLKSKKIFKEVPCKNCSSFETFENHKVVWDS